MWSTCTISCLLFSGKAVKDKRNVLFQKFLLSFIISEKTIAREKIYSEIKSRHKEFMVSEGNVESALNELSKQNFLREEAGVISLTDKARQDIDENDKNISEQVSCLINDILDKINLIYKKPINNINQVRSNIKDCISYYFLVAGYSFFEWDYRKKICEIDKLEDKASNNLPVKEKKELSNIIIYAIGDIIENPTDSQRKVLEFFARTYITIQIMGIDPLLNVFKQSLIREKVFILDTDVLLYLITDDAYLSRQYKIMIEQLLNCGCKIYVPKESIKEVYNHAEAAKKRFPFISNFIDDKSAWVSKEFKNVFIEDFYFKQLKEPNKYKWDSYIENYISSEYGISLTREVIKEKVGTKVNYDCMPEKVDVVDEELQQLTDASLEETHKTEKALHREEEKNEDIAKTDAIIYLYVKALNALNESRIGKGGTSNRTDLLKNRYYILTNSTRVHYCAKRLHLDANILCKPGSLMAYLAETGVIEKDQVKIITLFDNAFLQYTAQTVWNDVCTLVNSGVDIKGKNVVKMRFDLQEEIRRTLTEPESEYKNIYESTKQKGYSFNPMIEAAMKDSADKEMSIKQLEEEKKKLKEEMEGMKRQLDIANNNIIKRENVIKRNKYEKRVGDKSLKQFKRKKK